MRLWKTLNREQKLAAAAVTVGAILVAQGLVGGSVPAPEIPSHLPDRVCERPPTRYVGFLDESFDRYWQGRNIFEGETASKLPVPQVALPEPPMEDLAAPLFHPCPAVEAYNRLPVKRKYPALVAGAPAIPADAVPSADEIKSLLDLQLPDAAPRRDRRADREREFFVLILKRDQTRKEGSLVEETKDYVEIRNRETNQRERYPRDLVWKVEYNWTFEDIYKKQSREIAAGPTEAAKRLELARKVLDWGMLPEAREELYLAIEAKQDFVDAYLMLGKILAEEDLDLDGAVIVYEQGIAAGAPPAELHYEIGRCLDLLGLPEGAALAFERAVDASPRHCQARLALARAYLELDRPRATADAVEDFFVKFAGAAPEDLKTEGFVVRGLARLRRGEMGPARADFAEAVRRDPARTEAVHALAAIDAVEGNAKKAGEGFTATIRAAPGMTDAWNNLGTLLLLAGRMDDAETVFAAAAGRDPASGDARVGLGLARIAAGKQLDGEAALAEALKIEPHHAGALSLAASLKLKEHADEDALALFTEALRGEPAWMPACSGAALANLRLGWKLVALAGTMTDEAKAAKSRADAREQHLLAEGLLRAVRDLDPERPRGWLALACAQTALHRGDEARASLREARRLLQDAGRPLDPRIPYAMGAVEVSEAVGDAAARHLGAAAIHFGEGAQLEDMAKDPADAEWVAKCKTALEDIETWKVTSLRLDDRFDRPASDAVGASWIEVEANHGVSISLDGKGRARFGGVQTRADMGMTCLERAIPSEDFYALEATFYPEKTGRTEYGLSIYHSQQGASRLGFHVGVDMQGKVRFRSTASYPNDMEKKDMGSGWTEIKTPLPNPQEVTLRITREEKNKVPNFNILFLDPAKGEWVLAQKDIPAPSAGSGKGPWTISIFARAWRDQEVQIGLDNVRVFERERK